MFFWSGILNSNYDLLMCSIILRGVCGLNMSLVYLNLRAAVMTSKLFWWTRSLGPLGKILSWNGGRYEYLYVVKHKPHMTLYWIVWIPLILSLPFPMTFLLQYKYIVCFIIWILFWPSMLSSLYIEVYQTMVVPPQSHSGTNIFV